MAINETVNLLKNQASTAVKEKILNLNKARADHEAERVDGVTDTDSTDATNPAAAAVSAANDPAEQFDTFLRLLTAQIENQDPLAPLDSTQFVEQLATFSGLELQATANNTLTDIEALLTRQIALVDDHNNHTAQSVLSQSL